MSSPPEEPQPQPEDTRSLIKSPGRIHRWMDGTGEFNQPISPSNNVPNSPPSGNPYDLDGVNLRSPSIGPRPAASHDVFVAAFNREGAQTGAGFTGNNQQPNQEAPNASDALLGQMTTHHNLVGQIQQRNEHLLGNTYELSPIPNSGDNAHQAIPAGNNRVENPPNSTLLQYHNENRNALLNIFPDSPYGEFQPLDQRALQMDTASGMMNAMNNYSYQPGYGGLQPPDQRVHQADTASGMMNTMNDYSFQPRYSGLQPPSQTANQADTAIGMMNTMNDYSSQPRYSGLQPLDRRAHQAGTATGMMNTMNSNPSQTRYGGLQPPGQRGNQADMTRCTIVASMADHFCRPLVQRARQFDMATAMMNPMNNYQGEMHGQVPVNNPVPTYHTDNQNDFFGYDPQDQEVQQNDVFGNNPQYPEVHQNDIFENNPHYPEVHQNDIFENNPPYPEVQQNDHMLNNYNMDSAQQTVQSSGDNMPSSNLPGTTPQQNILESIEQPPHNPQPNASPQQVHYVDESDDAFTTPDHSLTTPSQNMPVPHTPSGYVSDQRAPGAVGTGLGVFNVPGNMTSGQHVVQNEQGLGGPNAPGDMPSNQYEVANDEDNMLPNQHIVQNEQDLGAPNVPDNMPPNQHIVQHEQDLYTADAPGDISQSEHIDRNDPGEMPTSGGDQMDTSEDRIQFGRLSTIAQLAQLSDSIPDAPEPFNTINSGPFFPQDASPMQPLQLDSNPTATSNVEEAGAAFDSEEAGTRSARIFPPNIPGTLAPSMHQAQMEAPHARNTFKHPARNDKSDTRKDPPRDANRVNKSIRRRKPAKTQKLQSAIANSASQLLEESAPQAAEAQNNPENSKSQAIEAQDESETSVESVD
ncbi:uncharacterized protein EAE97_008102 [Botrytis byssoidea]|uniref:Uncharacterized protein n=1 Tax=Botrytis byssoidea TaxID=139641 RepID=A0A9P5I9E4_9HELO|nr:uncharacterized protein EAE97_008102 [Botrytis byssoidea]KAF7935195.1 hypothetical protein EAE97_008102 [Botrytis byssoidea]